VIDLLIRSSGDLVRWRIEDTPEQAAFREGFRDWLRGVFHPGWAEAIEEGDEKGFTAAFAAAQDAGWNFFTWMRTIGESGYAAPQWPREYGGLSGELWTLRVVREELARYRLPTFGPNILGVGLVGPTIIAHGTEAQKERYLAPILTGEEIWCQLFSEPGSGSDLASLASRAVRDGDEWVINGQKVWTTLAQLSKFGLMLTRTDPDLPKHAGLTYFIVEMQQPGVEIRPLTQLTGSAEFNEVYFSDVRVPDENRVGDVNDGWTCARTTLMNERNTIAGLTLDMTSVLGGSARADPSHRLREQIAACADPVLRAQLTQAYIEQELKDVNVFRANLARQTGRDPGGPAAIGKVFNAELAQRRASLAIDAAGMAGVAWMPGDRTAAARAEAFLRARANTIEGGTSEVLRSQIGERVLGLPREPEPDRNAPWKSIRRS
jgi:alkylation response protein AidB-like acyl-CoA dehydrogenase